MDLDEEFGTNGELIVVNRLYKNYKIPIGLVTKVKKPDSRYDVHAKFPLLL